MRSCEYPEVSDVSVGYQVMVQEIKDHDQPDKYVEVLGVEVDFGMSMDELDIHLDGRSISLTGHPFKDHGNFFF